MKEIKWATCTSGKIFTDNQGSVVYYANQSGSTHLLKEPAIFILEKLSEQPMTTRELAHTMADRAADMAIEDLGKLLDHLLLELREFDLIDALATK